MPSLINTQPSRSLSTETTEISFDDRINVINLYTMNTSELSSDFYEWLMTNFNEEGRTGDQSFLNPYSVRARAVFIGLYALIFIMSLVGNSLVCLVVARNKRMRGVTNFFLANQACSDMVMTALNIPFILYAQLTYGWPFGYLMCHLTDYLAVASVYVSCFTFTAIALDRHRVIVHPLRPRISMTTAITIAVGIWILAVVLPIPFAVCREVVKVKDSIFDFQMCVASYPYPFFGKSLVLGTFFIQFAIPLTINSIAYIHIGTKLWRATSVGDVTARQHRAAVQAKTRTTLMLVLVVAAFAICWFPLNVYLLVSNFDSNSKNTLAYLWCHFIANSSVCINPVAFGFLNENFRAELRYSLNCCMKRVTLRHRYVHGRRTRYNRDASHRNSQVGNYSQGYSPTRVTNVSLPLEVLKARDKNDDCDVVKNKLIEDNGMIESNDSGVA